MVKPAEGSKKKKTKGKVDDEDEAPKRTRPIRRKKEKENRTIFVGNVPVAMDKKVRLPI